MDYDPFIKSQLAFTQLTFGRYVVQIWSCYTLELRGNEKGEPGGSGGSVAAEEAREEGEAKSTPVVVNYRGTSLTRNRPPP